MQKNSWSGAKEKERPKVSTMVNAESSGGINTIVGIIATIGVTENKFPCYGAVWNSENTVHWIAIWPPAFMQTDGSVEVRQRVMQMPRQSRLWQIKKPATK